MAKKHSGKAGKGRKSKKNKEMKTLPEILAEVQALADVAEDQYETALAAVVTDLQAYIAGTPAAPTATSVAITFSDGSVQTLPTA